MTLKHRLKTDLMEVDASRIERIINAIVQRPSVKASDIHIRTL